MMRIKCKYINETSKDLIYYQKLSHAMPAYSLFEGVLYISLINEVRIYFDSQLFFKIFF